MDILKKLESYDLLYLKFFHDIQSKSNDLFFSFITWFGSLWTIIPFFIILCLVLIKNGFTNLIFPLGVGFIGAVTTTYFLKYTIDRERPHLFHVIGDMPNDPSFPSAHTTQIFIFVLLLIILLFSLNISYKYFISFGLMTLAILVASSRIYLQVHYLSDVIIGFTVALFWSFIAYYLLNQQNTQ